MRSQFFSGPDGSSLANMGKFLQSSDTEDGNTERAKIAANAAKMSAWYGMQASKAKTEADAHAKQADDARGYFALNMQDAQNKALLAHQTEQEAVKWGQQAQLQNDTLSSNERVAALNNDGMNTRAGLQYKNQLVPPSVALERERQSAIEKENESLAIHAAQMANRTLMVANAAKKEEQQKIWDAPNGLFTSDAAGGKVRQKGIAKSEEAFQAVINRIHSGLADLAPLVRYNDSTKLFEPSMGQQARPQQQQTVPQMPNPFSSDFGRPVQFPEDEVNAQPQADMAPATNVWKRGPDGKIVRSKPASISETPRPRMNGVEWGPSAY